MTIDDVSKQITDLKVKVYEMDNDLDIVHRTIEKIIIAIKQRDEILSRLDAKESGSAD